MPSREIYRVQDVRGRGPFRPGFGKKWSDKVFVFGMKSLPTWMDEFGIDLVKKVMPGEVLGSGVRNITDISKWFSFTEQKKLDDFGYKVCCIVPDRILAESENQLVFARKMPLSEDIKIVEWPYLGIKS